MQIDYTKPEPIVDLTDYVGHTVSRILDDSTLRGPLLVGFGGTHGNLKVICLYTGEVTEVPAGARFKLDPYHLKAGVLDKHEFY